MSYSGRDNEFARIYLGRNEENLRHIKKMLDSTFRNFRLITPEAKYKFTQDAYGQYWVHINGRGLYYLFIKLQDIAEREATLERQEAAADQSGLEKLGDFLSDRGF